MPPDDDLSACMRPQRVVHQPQVLTFNLKSFWKNWLWRAGKKICNCSLTERDLLKDTSSNGSGGCLRSKAWNMARRRPLKPRSWSMASLLQPPQNSLLCRLTKWVRRWGWCREAIGQEVEAWPWLWRFHYHEFDQLDQIWSKRYSWGWQPLECAFELAAWFAAVCSPEVFLERGDLTLEACKSGTSPAKSWYIIMSKWECCLPPRNIPQPLCFWKARPTSLTWGALLKCLTIQHWSSSISVSSSRTPFRSESRRGATHWHRHWWSHMAEKGLGIKFSPGIYSSASPWNSILENRTWKRQ